MTSGQARATSLMHRHTHTRTHTPCDCKEDGCGGRCLAFFLIAAWSPPRNHPWRIMIPQGWFPGLCPGTTLEELWSPKDGCQVSVQEPPLRNHDPPRMVPRSPSRNHLLGDHDQVVQQCVWAATFFHSTFTGLRCPCLCPSCLLVPEWSQTLQLLRQSDLPGSPSEPDRWFISGLPRTGRWQVSLVLEALTWWFDWGLKVTSSFLSVAAQRAANHCWAALRSVLSQRVVFSRRWQSSTHPAANPLQQTLK